VARSLYAAGVVSAFVGRTDELLRIAEVAAQAGNGPVAAIVLGDPGSGKTRLLAEAAERIEVGTALRVTGYEPEARVPLAAAADLLRTLAEVPKSGPPLAAIVFDAADSSALEPMRVFETAHRALDAVEPALVWMDDLQWADELSLALCHYLLRAAQTTGQCMTLLGAARPSMQATSFVASLAQLLPDERFAAIELGPLSREEAVDLANELAPSLDKVARRDLAALSGGSPFWLEALARTQGAPADAGQLVTARLRGAGSDASTLLALLAVAGRPLALADAAVLEGWSTERAEHAAAELVARGVAIHTAGGIRLAHDLIREAAVAEIPDEKRRDVHGRLADWLEGVAGNDLRRLREALDHRHGAGLPSLELATRLACSPQRTLLGEKGLGLLTSIADASEATREDVLFLNRETASLAGELANYRVALERWLVVTERATDPEQRASAFVKAARSALALDDGDEARRLLGAARELNIRDELFELELETTAATVGLWSGEDRAPARALAAEVVGRSHRFVAGAGGIDSLDARARGAFLETLRLEYELAYQNDDVDALLASTDQRAEVARGFDTESYLAARIAGARALRRIGRLGEAEHRLRSALTEAQRAVLPQLTIDAAYWLASVLELLGKMAEAEEIVSEALELAARAGDEALGRHGISRLALKIGFHRGDWRSAVTGLREHSRDVSTHGRIELYQDGALWLALVGGDELESDSLSWLADARACAEKAACPRCGTELHLAAAEVLVRIGHPAEAERSLAAWRGLQKHPQPRDEVVQRRTKALIRASSGNGTAAADLESAADLAEQREFTLDALWTRIDLGRVLGGSDHERAIATLRDAAETALRLGAVTEQQVAEKSLRALGVRTWRRGAAAAEPLTAREHEIARLISEGASNPEIAQQLFLSRKTVERHVSNVFKKVGVRNRAELAAKAAELEVEGAPR
jgi:DNA-binding CsgD family transcriptional regulator